MPINFITNDPAAPNSSAQQIAPSPNRTGSKVDFAINQLPPEQVYQTDTNDFVAWQAREAALRTLNTFEAIAGPLIGWMGQAGNRQLALIPNDSQDLNAYYDRNSISFFEFPLGARTLFSGASTDVVAHETGHAILDSLRPDLWNSKMLEIAAFHEGFGDCMAIMTALSDQATRIAILQADPTLGAANFVEAIAEDLSAGVAKAISPNHNAAKPRHALNTFQWALPQSLPMDGKPDVLINEIHSFGQLSCGCFYEMIREIFLAGPRGEAGLWQACQTATKLLAMAVKEAPIRARFLEAVGSTMVLVDRKLQTPPANEAFIRTAFQRHGVSLQVTASLLAPRVALQPLGAATRKPRRGGKTAKSAKGRKGSQAAAMLGVVATRALHTVLGITPQARIQASYFAPTGRQTAQMVGYRSVDLTGLSERLSNVKAYTPYSALVSSGKGKSAVVGALDAGAIVSLEVRSYVETLIHRGQIDFGQQAAPAAGAAKKAKAKKATAKKTTAKKTAAKKPKVKKATARKARASKARARGAGFIAQQDHPTHVLKRVGGEIVLERARFLCGCNPTRFRCVNA